MGIEKWSTSAGSNNMAPPDGWPGGMLPSQVEPTGRQMMASIASWYQAAEWINYNFPIVYSSATVFTISTNVTALYHVGRRVQATDGSTSVFGTITASVFTSLTTVTVVWDSGVLQTGVTIAYVGITSAVNTSAPNQAANLLASNNTWSGLNTFNGKVVVAAPASGVAVSATGIANQYAGLFTAGGTAGTQKGLSAVTTTQNAADKIFNVNNSASNLLDIFGDGHGDLGPNLSWTVAGNWLVGAPTSGAALTTNAVAGGISGVFRGAAGNDAVEVINAGASSAFGLFVQGGRTAADYAVNVVNAALTGTYFRIAGDGSWLIGTNGSSNSITGTAAGNVVVAAPSSGNTLSLNGAASGATLAISGSSTTGQSIGGIFQAGTSASDFGLEVISASGSFTQFKVRGDGVVFGNDGTNLLELGYKDVPLNVQSSNYQLTAADRGKAVQAGATITVTVPSGVFSGGAAITIFVGSGATVTIAQGAGMSLQWAGNGASTGSRTLTGAGMATILYASSGVALISGAGLT